MISTSRYGRYYSLTEDEDPTPHHEAHYGGSTMEPFTLAMNTIRGEAMEAVIRYALWFRRHKEQEQQDIAHWLDEMPGMFGTF